MTLRTQKSGWVSIITLTALLLVTGCSKSEVVTSYPDQVAKQDYTKQQPAQQEVNNNPVPIVFDASIGEQATTRAEGAGTAVPTQGFGVFAYLTNGNYSSTTAPNFMYNQRIFSENSGTTWQYAPIKYWPNDFNGSGAVDNRGATGTQTQKLSFFAYGPYVYVNPSTGFVYKDAALTQLKTEGIMKFTNNTETGDPMLYYRVGGVDAEDLVWGTADADASYTDASGTSITVTEGYPIKNVTKMTVGGKLKFKFQHVLTAFTVNVGAFFDEGTAQQQAHESPNESWSPSITIADDNYITLESVRIQAANLPQEGWLNLDTSSSTLSMMDINKNLINSYPNYDLTLSGTDIVDYLRDLGASTKENIYDATNNPTGTITGVGRAKENGDGGNLKVKGEGVPGLTHPLLGEGKSIVSLPKGSSTTITITVKYNVWTLDPRAVAGITKVENTITNTVTIGMAGGSNYAINLWLGMRTVELTVNKFSNTGEWSGVETNLEIPK